MMRHHFQSQYFWHYYTNNPDNSNDIQTKDDSSKDPDKVEKHRQIARPDLTNHHKVDCVFIIIALFIVSGFTLTISSYGTQKFQLGEQVYDTTVGDAPQGETDMIDVNDILKHTIPQSYLLYLFPKIHQRTYTGIVKINFQCKKALSRVTFHSTLHNVHSVVLRSYQREIPIEKLRDKRRGVVILVPHEALVPGEDYELLITNSGILTFDRKQALHLMEYADNLGDKHEMLMTNFGYSGAREAWPCIDDPSMKATWKIIVQHDKKYRAISNMPAVAMKHLETDLVETYFQVSPKMSSSSVSLILTEQKHKEATLSNGMKIRTFAPPGQLEYTKLALKVASLVVDYFSNKFHFVNPLKKLDLVSVDSKDHHSESWGIMVLDKDYFFDNSSMNSLFSMEKLALAISKQVCHQWFGDLVTPKKKSEAWLKDAVCGYLQILPLQYYYPSWSLDDWFYLNIVYPAMKYDANKYTHSIAFATKGTSGHKALTYYKPASLVAMLANFIGKHSFLKGLNIYLKKFQFSTADPNDLWNALSQVSSINVSVLMNEWINQPGFPVLTVKRVKSGLLIEQERFAFNKSNVKSKIWQIPVSVKICGQNSEYILKTKQGIIPIDTTCDADADYILNYGATGFFHVGYNQSNWMRLLKLINNSHKQIPAIDRANLLANLHSLGRFNYVDISLLLDFTQYLGSEYHFVPWRIAANILDELYDLFYNTEITKCTKEYTIKQITPVINHLNKFRNHLHPQKRLISLLLGYAVRYQRQEFLPIRMQMENRFFKWQVSNGKMNIASSIRNVILSAGIFSGGNNEWNFVFKQYLTGESNEMKDLLLSLLSSSSKISQLERLVNYGKHNISMLTHVCRNNIGRNIAWRTVLMNWHKLFNNSCCESTFESLLTACLGSGTTDDDLTKAKHTKSLLPDDSKLILVMDRIIQDIQVNISYRKEEKYILEWFRKNGVC